MYQATTDKPEMQKRMYEALTRALNSEHDPGILVGDFNTRIKEGRTNYDQPNPSNTTTMTDATFTDFVEKKKGKIRPPVHDSWRNPFGGIRNREAKLDFAITYNFEEGEVEDYVDWISMVHDHVRVGFVIGDSLWEGIQYTPRPTPTPSNPSNGKRFKITQMLPVVKEVNEECAPMAEDILSDPDVSSR
jgi:hypothetical protein